MDPKRSLSEISHLFLSEVRERQSSAPRPTRIPPPKRPEVSVDLTPEEFAASLEADTAEVASDTPPSANASQVSIVLSSHLGESGSQSVRQYARHLAQESGCIGLIEADGGEFGLTCFEPGAGEAATPEVIDNLNGRRMAETIAELSFDVERWLISLPNPRTPEARELLRAAPHWVLLTTTDHDGVVATYRALKGLAELGRPRLSLVVLDARDDEQADAVFRKIDAVSRQFLGCQMEAEAPVRPAQNVMQHAILNCRAPQDHTSTSPAPQWPVIGQFLSSAIAPQVRRNAPEVKPMKSTSTETPVATSIPKMTIAQESIPRVIDLAGEQSERSILDAVIRQGGADGHWIQCPIHPPMCRESVLAVGRDHRLILLAVAGRGLSELRAIGLSLKWMAENGELIRMALPQLAIDVSAAPMVRLLVDHADLSADILQPLLASGTVEVQAYRKLKWGEKVGLLLEAA